MNTFTFHLRRSRAVASACLLCVAVLVPGLAKAQAHTVSEGGYTLRASTVAAQNLPKAMLEQHQIPRDPRKAVLNVMVGKAGSGPGSNVSADVKVQVRNLYGVKTDVAMRQVSADGQVSYLGVYDFLPREVLEFSISARPAGVQRELRLEFRDRLTKP